MENIELISITDLCKYHEVSYTFITGLHEAGLIDIISEQEQNYLRGEQLSELEKLVRFHKEMDINLEGIETIAHLLHKMDAMQERLRSLQQRLRLYENGQ